MAGTPDVKSKKSTLQLSSGLVYMGFANSIVIQADGRKFHSMIAEQEADGI